MENREIKFRAWNGEEMKDSFIISRPQFVNALSIMHTEKFAKENYKLKEWKVMQFTGFKDNNEKYIYDGDIIKMTYPSSVIEIGQVKWWDKYGTWATDIKSIGAYSLEFLQLYEAASNKVEVIGNIYENPELLVSSN